MDDWLIWVSYHLWVLFFPVHWRCYVRVSKTCAVQSRSNWIHATYGSGCKLTSSTSMSHLSVFSCLRFHSMIKQPDKNTGSSDALVLLGLCQSELSWACLNQSELSPAHMTSTGSRDLRLSLKSTRTSGQSSYHDFVQCC